MRLHICVYPTYICMYIYRLSVPCSQESEDPGDGGGSRNGRQAAVCLPGAQYVVCPAQHGCQTHNTRNRREDDHIECGRVIGDSCKSIPV